MNTKKCRYKLIRGKNTGKKCNKPCIDESKYCRNHHNKTVNYCSYELLSKKCKNISGDEKFCHVHRHFKRCPFILIHGKRKGFICNRRCEPNADHCYHHNTKRKRYRSKKPRCSFVSYDGTNCNNIVNNSKYCYKHKPKREIKQGDLCVSFDLF